MSIDEHIEYLLTLQRHTMRSGEDMGMNEFAGWLKPFVPEAPIRWIPTTDEIWAV